MNTVIYYSCTGHSATVAEILAEELGFGLCELNANTQEELLSRKYSTAVVVFPVHCQSYPAFMKKFFKELKTERIAPIATYGKANAGNALYEAAKLISGKIIAAAYIPVGHSYLNDGYVPSEIPQALIEKLRTYTAVNIPKRKKTPFAGFFPTLRSRMIIKIMRNERCVGCDLCGGVCPKGAIKRGNTNAKCVRCLKCVATCPEGALEVKRSRVLPRYLDKTRHDEVILYLH